LELRQPEIKNLDVSVLRDQHVGRLQIAMQDAASVCGRHRIRQLDADAQQIVEREALRGDARREEIWMAETK
jgi:hypothetical protein